METMVWLLPLVSGEDVQDNEAMVGLSTVTMTFRGFSVSSSIHSPVGPGMPPEGDAYQHRMVACPLLLLFGH